MLHIAKSVSYIINTNRFWNMYKHTHPKLKYLSQFTVLPPMQFAVISSLHFFNHFEFTFTENLAETLANKNHYEYPLYG